MRVAIIGAGPAGLFLGAALARRGHAVTAVDRDPGPAGDARWERRGVMQFHHAHAFRQTVADALAREVPDALAGWLGLGAEPISGGMPGAPEGPMGHRSMRETFERALRAAACAAPGFTLRRGTSTRWSKPAAVPRASSSTARRTTPTWSSTASGRNGRVDPRLGERAGIGGPCGQAYVDRVYRLRRVPNPGRCPTRSPGRPTLTATSAWCSATSEGCSPS